MQNFEIPSRTFLVLFFVFFSALGASRSQHVYRSVEALPPIERSVDDEITLDADRLAAVKDEPALDEKNILAAINRRHAELYPGSPAAAVAYMLALVMDPLTAVWAKELSVAASGGKTTEEKIQAMFLWIQERMCHTQMTGVFETYPGFDPWGVDENGVPTYKKLLPPEMDAMAMHTGKISGKCITLANLVTSLFLHMGVAPENIIHVLVRLPSGYRHGNALLDYNGTVLLVNNNAVGRFILEPVRGAPAQIGEAVYNHLDFREASFIIDADSIRDPLLDSGTPMMKRLLSNSLLEKIQEDFGAGMPLSVGDPEALRRSVLEETDISSQASLARYAYQSLYVKYPGWYLTASLRNSLSKELAKRMRTTEDVFRWIEDHIRPGSIFRDGGERIMTSDQVLVFQRGSMKDRALLAATLLNHMGFSAKVLIARYIAYVVFEDRVVEALAWTDVENGPKNPLISFCAE